MTTYTIRPRQEPPFRRGLRDRMLRRPVRTLERPWELLRDGVSIGFYETPQAATDATPPGCTVTVAPGTPVICGHQFEGGALCSMNPSHPWHTDEAYDIPGMAEDAHAFVFA